MTTFFLHKSCDIAVVEEAADMMTGFDRVSVVVVVIDEWDGRLGIGWERYKRS